MPNYGSRDRRGRSSARTATITLGGSAEGTVETGRDKLELSFSVTGDATSVTYPTVTRSTFPIDTGVFQYRKLGQYEVTALEMTFQTYHSELLAALGRANPGFGATGTRGDDTRVPTSTGVPVVLIRDDANAQNRAGTILHRVKGPITIYAPQAVAPNGIYEYQITIDPAVDGQYSVHGKSASTLTVAERSALAAATVGDSAKQRADFFWDFEEGEVWQGGIHSTLEDARSLGLT